MQIPRPGINNCSAITYCGPEGFDGMFDWISALISLAAAIALFKFKLNVIHVIAASATIGLIVKTLILWSTRRYALLCAQSFDLRHCNSSYYRDRQAKHRVCCTCSIPAADIVTGLYLAPRWGFYRVANCRSLQTNILVRTAIAVIFRTATHIA